MAYERAIGLSRPAPPDGKRHLINPMYADQLGWKTMTQTVAGAYWSLPPAQRKITAVFADRYAYAGALDYYGPRYGLPPVISPNNSYYLWGTRGYSGSSMLGGRRDRLLRCCSIGSAACARSRSIATTIAGCSKARCRSTFVRSRASRLPRCGRR